MGHPSFFVCNSVQRWNGWCIVGNVSKILSRPKGTLRTASTGSSWPFPGGGDMSTSVELQCQHTSCTLYMYNIAIFAYICSISIFTYVCVCVSFSVSYFPALTCPCWPWQLDTLPMDEEPAASPTETIVTPSPLPPKTLDETPDKARL